MHERSNWRASVRAPTRMKPRRFAHVSKKSRFSLHFCGFTLAFAICVRYSSNRLEFSIEK